MTAAEVADAAEQTPKTKATGHARLKVEGMTCSACVGHVERALKAVPGVSAATVNLGTEQADIDFANGVDVGTLARAVEDAGYGVTKSEITLSVTGMTCAACVGHVERALKGVPGVLDASVNLGTESARITAVGVEASDLVAVVEGAGYGAAISDGGAPAEEVERAADRREMRVVLASALLSLPLVVPMLCGS